MYLVIIKQNPLQSQCDNDEHTKHSLFSATKIIFTGFPNLGQHVSIVCIIAIMPWVFIAVARMVIL
jgi:hypothetical protein